jgi:hypothetical protein
LINFTRFRGEQEQTAQRLEKETVRLDWKLFSILTFFQGKTYRSTIPARIGKSAAKSKRASP